MPLPRLSVIMASYNGADYVGAAVRSVLSQTFRDFELVIVDDGSRAETVAILQHLASGDSRIRVIFGEHQGQIATLNRALDACRGALLARLDHDDIAQPSRFAQQVAYLDAHADCVMVGTRTCFIDTAGNDIGGADEARTMRTLRHAPLAFPPRVPFVHGSTPMMRADVFRSVGGFRAEFTAAEDRDVSWRMAACGRVARLGEPLVKHRLHDRNLSKTGRRTQILSHFFCDLSAAATALGLDDAAARRCIEVGGDFKPALDAYRTLLHRSYPVETYWQFHLARERGWDLVGIASGADFMGHVARQLLANPVDLRRWRTLFKARKGVLKAAAGKVAADASSVKP